MPFQFPGKIKISDFTRLARNSTPTHLEEETRPAGLQGIRERYREAGLNEEATSLVIQSWRGNTRKSYCSYINKWLKYTKENRIETITIGHFANFLSTLFSQGNSHSTVNLARSAVSSFLAAEGFLGYGSHPIINRLLKGVFNVRPSLPKYQVTWDVDIVIKYLNNLPDLINIDLKSLSMRLTMLLCLLSGQRGEAIFKIQVKDVVFEEDKCRIIFSSLLKNSKPYRHAKPWEVNAFDNKRLCVVEHLKCYIEKTEEIRGGEEQLLISYIKPYKAIARDTLSRWIKTTMKAAGINTEVFSAHSTRSASTSAAIVKDVSLDKLRNFKTKVISFYNSSCMKKNHSMLNHTFVPFISSLYALSLIQDF